MRRALAALVLLVAAAAAQDTTCDGMPICAAAASGDTGALTAALAAAADEHGRVDVGVADAVDVDGWTAVMRASLGGHAAAIELLLKAGADVDAATPREQPQGGATGVHAAAIQGHLAAAKALIAGGASVNSVTAEGLTPLMEAAYEAHQGSHAEGTALVKLLLASGARTRKLKDSAGDTALMQLEKLMETETEPVRGVDPEKVAAVRAQLHELLKHSEL